MTEHHRPSVRRLQRKTQQLIVLYFRANRRGVVAQFPNLSSSLVHEAQRTFRGAHRAGAEERHPPGLQKRRNLGRVEVEAVARDQQLNTCRIATANLQPVERRECLVHRQAGRHRTGRRIRAHQVDDADGCPKTIPGDGPRRVPQGDQPGVDRLNLIGGHVPGRLGRLDAIGQGIQAFAGQAQLGDTPGVGQQRRSPVETPERSVNLGGGRSSGAQRLPAWGGAVACETVGGVVQLCDQRSKIEAMHRRGSTQQGDDSTHRGNSLGREGIGVFGELG